jgi:hypothetical protein
MPAIRATGIAGAAIVRGPRLDRRRRWTSAALVVLQVAVSLVLVVGALLFVRSLRNLMTLDAGFSQDGILIASLDLRRTGIAQDQFPVVFGDVTTRLAALPGVQSAAQAFIVPVSGSGWNNSIVIRGKSPNAATGTQRHSSATSRPWGRQSSPAAISTSAATPPTPARWVIVTIRSPGISSKARTRSASPSRST